MKKGIIFRLKEEFEVSKMKINSAGTEVPVDTQIIRVMDWDQALRIYLEWHGGEITLATKDEFIRSARIRRLPWTQKWDAYDMSYSYIYFS